MTDVKRHQERALLSLVQPDDEKKAELEKEVGEKNLVMQERCVKAEREVEQLRLSLQTKCSDTETAQRELAQLNFKVEQLKAELDRAKQDSLSKDINLRGYSEIAQLNNELNSRNIEMVTKVNDLQGKIDQVEGKEKVMVELQEKIKKTEDERDKIKLLARNKMIQLKELEKTHTDEIKGLQDKFEASMTNAHQASISIKEKKEFIDALDLLKSENQNLQSRVDGNSNNMGQIQVFRSLMRALDRAKQIIQTLDERGQNQSAGQQQQASAAGDNVQGQQPQ